MTATPTVSRRDLVAWLDRSLEIRRHPDKSLNGLQVEGRDEVTRLAVGVDSSLATLEEAVASGADFLIVHHGLFWGEPLALTGPHLARVRTCLEGGLSLYAAHLPLDIHPEVGNNAALAGALSLGDLEPFGEVRGLKIGVKGRLPVPITLSDLADAISRVTGEACLVHNGGPNEVSTLGIVSGSAAGLIPQAAAEGLDAFVTGEPEHKHFSDPFELGVNAVFAGHYVTEMLGPRALAVRLEEEFGLPWQFLHQPTGL